MSLDRWILQMFDLKTSINTYWMHSVPRNPFSSSVGCLTFVNGIHQWPAIRWRVIMFDLNTYIDMMGHVPSSIFVEDLKVWWNSIYASTLIIIVPMGFQFSYQRNVPSCTRCFRSIWILDTTMHCTWFWPLMIYVYYAYPWPLYFYIYGASICTPNMQSCIQSYHCIILMSGYIFHLDLHYSTHGTIIMYFSHHVTLWPHTLGGIYYSMICHTSSIIPWWPSLVPMQTH